MPRDPDRLHREKRSGIRDLRDSLSDSIAEVFYRDERIQIEKKNKPVAAVIPMALYERLLPLEHIPQIRFTYQPSSKDDGKDSQETHEPDKNGCVAWLTQDAEGIRTLFVLYHVPDEGKGGVGWVLMQGPETNGRFITRGWQPERRDDVKEGAWVTMTCNSTSVDATLQATDPAAPLKGTWQYDEPHEDNESKGEFELPRAAFVQAAPSDPKARRRRR